MCLRSVPVDFHVLVSLNSFLFKACLPACPTLLFIYLECFSHFHLCYYIIKALQVFQQSLLCIWVETLRFLICDAITHSVGVLSACVSVNLFFFSFLVCF